jgi:hypothetical protein
LPDAAKRLFGSGPALWLHLSQYGLTCRCLIVGEQFLHGDAQGLRDERKFQGPEAALPDSAFDMVGGSKRIACPRAR